MRKITDEYEIIVTETTHEDCDHVCGEKPIMRIDAEWAGMYLCLDHAKELIAKMQKFIEKHEKEE